MDMRNTDDLRVTLQQSSLPTGLIDKMVATAQAQSIRCPICRVGKGRMCLDREGIPTYDGFHLARTMIAEADDLLRAAYGR